MNEKIKTKPGFPRLVPDEDICQETSDGIIITVEVSAGSKREMFPNGYNPWRKAFGIAVKAPPVEGRANKAVIKIISGYFSVPSSSVTIISGQTSSLKKVRICGVTRHQVIELITGV